VLLLEEEELVLPEEVELLELPDVDAVPEEELLEEEPLPVPVPVPVPELGEELVEPVPLESPVVEDDELLSSVG